MGITTISPQDFTISKAATTTPNGERFLNVDDTSILLASVGNAQSANLYAYCNNNPVNRVDYTGYEETVNPNHWNAAVLSISINLLPFVLNPYTEKLLYDSFNIAVNSKDNKTYIAKIIISADLAATILYCININESLTYELLASTLDYYAFFNDGKNPRRHLLFSIDCMAKEIKDHFEGYLAAAEKKLVPCALVHESIFELRKINGIRRKYS